MESRIKKLVLAAGLCAGLVVAPAAQAAAGWTSFGAITEFNLNPPISPGAEMLFIKVGAATSPSTCTVTNGFYLSITTDHQKRLFALLTAAKLAQQRVQVYVTGNCHVWGFAELTGIVVE